jgi:hypothetical protein
LGDHVFVKSRFDNQLIGILRNDRKREIADRHDDPGDITLKEEPPDIGGQMVDLELQQAAVSSLEQLHVDVQHRQREVAHRDAEEFTKRRTRHRRESEQTEMGEPEPAAHIDAQTGRVGKAAKDSAHRDDLIRRRHHCLGIVEISWTDPGAREYLGCRNAALVRDLAEHPGRINRTPKIGRPRRRSHVLNSQLCVR